jgi:nucleoside-diphosphate-sugar epimerase
MKILVTGNRGFIGRHLCTRLVHAGNSVVVGDGIVRDYVDVSNLNQLQSIEKADAIIHLAAKSSITNSIKCPYETYYTNVLGTLNLLELAKLKNIPKFIFSSTYVYGQPKYLPVDEKHPVDPHSHYHQSKLLAEKLCESYSQSFGIDTVILRPFHIYGPGCRPNSFMASVISQIEKNGKVWLSDERTKRDFLYINDFTDLIVSILDRFPNGYSLYNVGSGKSYTLKEVTRLLALLLHKKITTNYNSDMRPGDIISIRADISKVSSEFNWKPSIGLEKGLEMTIKN